MRRHGERGQALPIVALSGMVLIGATALAVDLSLQTSAKRQIQNVADTAALAGARDLYASGATLGGSDQSTAVADALVAVAGNMGWSVDLSSQDSYGDCSGYPTPAMNLFGLHGVCKTVTYQGDTITISTPPASPANVVDLDTHDLQVDISQTQSTNFASVIGFSSASEKGHAVARHAAGGVVYNWALFSNQYIQTGNSISMVAGNVYAGRAVNVQSAGKAAFCAKRTGVAGVDDGYIFLGAPQQGDGLPASSLAGQWGMLPATSRVITPLSTSGLSPECTYDNLSASKSGYVIQSGSSVQSGSPSCPTLSGAGPAYYNSTVQACEVTPVVLPPAPPPQQPAGATFTVAAPCNAGKGAGCWKSTPADGVWIVPHNAGCDPASNCFDLRIMQSIGTPSPPHITIWLKPGATFDVNMTGGGGSVLVAGPYNAGTGLAGDNRYVVYGESGSSMSVVGGKTSVEFQTGSIYMPSGTVTCSDSTANLTLDSGQAVADTWNVSSGNKPNPEITYNGAYAAVSSETLRLVE